MRSYLHSVVELRSFLTRARISDACERERDGRVAPRGNNMMSCRSIEIGVFGELLRQNIRYNWQQTRQRWCYRYLPQINPKRAHPPHLTVTSRQKTQKTPITCTYDTCAQRALTSFQRDKYLRQHITLEQVTSIGHFVHGIQFADYQLRLSSAAIRLFD